MRKALMQKSEDNNLMRIDLSNKSQEEIMDYFQALLSARYTLYKLGLKIKIDRFPKSSKSKIIQAWLASVPKTIVMWS